MAQTNSEDVRTTPDEIPCATPDMKEKVTDAVKETREKVQNVRRGVQSRVDESRAPAADKLEGAASVLHNRADSLPGGERVANLAHAAAGKMQATADYVRQHNVKDMMDDLNGFVRKHPVQSMFAAVVAGFLVGRALRSSD
ncbi:MAG TPA: hypothetical protein VH640_21175 [Bryobacteraceae bacterium]|jgi:ElaB/YqjD/DUF883 family membrane-anchored ribosome-binding protein